MANDLLIPETLTGEDVFANPDKPDRHKELIAQVRGEVSHLIESPDVSTKEGQDAIRTAAHKVSRSKTALDKMGDDLISGIRKKVDAVNAKRKTIRDELDKLRDEVRKPLTDWENAEKERIAKIQNRLEDLGSFSNWQMSQLTVDQIEEKIKEATEVARFDWAEKKAEAQEQWGKSYQHLQNILAERKKYDADQAELERLRKMEAEQKVTVEEAPPADSIVVASIDPATATPQVTVFPAEPAKALYEDKPAQDFPDKYTIAGLKIIVSHRFPAGCVIVSSERDKQTLIKLAGGQ